MTRRRPLLLPLALILIGVILVSACSRFENPGEDVVTDELTDLWADVGVDPDEAKTQGYGIDRQSDSDAETSAWCTDRDQSDRWVARRSATLRQGLVTQDSALAGLVSRYTGDRLRLFRSTTGTGALLFYAVDEERGIWVKADLDATGYMSVLVRHSICPIDGFATEPNTPYEEVPVPGA